MKFTVLVGGKKTKTAKNKQIEDANHSFSATVGFNLFKQEKEVRKRERKL